ncbi:MAG TPA: methylenetetrahydrofolate reductase [NAD(P)H] [Bacteroidales bacterium]|nr:methylenetetrahydrofolate reductase [NAD(P)H] [Bacteroidales bacterium]
MKITELFKTQQRTYSFEFFPPKDEISAVDFGINVGQLAKLNPSFITVTYGAGGSNQERTFALVDFLQNKIGLNTMAHYTCVNAPKSKIEEDLKTLSDLKIHNVMLLRGDPPKGQGTFVAHSEGFAYASDLVAFTKQRFDFCIGSAAYPEKHPEAASLDTDILHLKKKVDAGADFLVTQLFFRNDQYFEFRNKAKKAGICCRIIPGIIPLTAYQQIKRFTQMSGGLLPDSLLESMESYKDNPAKIYQIGMDYAIQQCRDLLIMGAPGIHFYTLNKSRATVEIFETLLGIK